MRKPFKHDCVCCEPLGAVRHHGVDGDGYACGDTLIIRFSDEPSDNAARCVWEADMGVDSNTSGFPVLKQRLYAEAT